MTTIRLKRDPLDASADPADTIAFCAGIVTTARAHLMATLPPANEPHVVLNRARRQYPEIFNDEIETALAFWRSPAVFTRDDAEVSVNLLMNTPGTASRLGLHAARSGINLQSLPRGKPASPTAPREPVEHPPHGDTFAYVPHNPNATIEDDDLVAFSYGKRTLYKPAGLLVYFDYRDGEFFDYWTRNGAHIQGQHHPVQPITKAKAARLTSNSNVEAARTSTVFRETFLRGADDNKRIFPPWYSRPRNAPHGFDLTAHLDFSNGFYLCRQCRNPLSKDPATGVVSCRENHPRP